MRKLTVEVDFEIDDQARSFGYALRHHGDTVTQQELAELFAHLSQALQDPGTRPEPPRGDG